MRAILVPALMALAASGILAQAPKALELVPPQKQGGMPILEVLAKRSTSRAFDTKELTPQQLSTLLWAAFGVNRPDGKRTAPSSMNKLETDIYVLLKQGVYVYDAQQHWLVPVLADDIRELGGKQPFVKDAPVTMVFVANLSKMGNSDRAEKLNTANIDAGFISQNVYLYCASEGLATGVRGWVDKETLAKRLKLRADQQITVAQSVGYPKLEGAGH